MTSGGARNRSGPAVDPNSGRSDRRGLVLRSLPASGYDEESPEFPLPDATVREIVVWEQAWRSPQACAWAEEPWRWLIVGMWVRWSVRMEDPDAPASLGQVVIRYADQIGMTPAGLKENGWKIDGQPEDAGSDKPVETPRRSSRDRLKVVTGGAGA